MRKLSLLLILLCIPASLFAQDDPGWRDRRASRDRYRNNSNAFELTPIIGYRYGGTIYASETDLFARDVDVASHMNYGVNFGIPIAGNLKLELMANRQDTNFERGGGLFDPNDDLGKFSVTYYHAGLQIPVAVSRNAEPYVIISGGIANLKPEGFDASADNRFSASIGGGVKLPFSNNVGVRFEARGYFTSLTGNDCDRCFSSFYRDRNFYQGETNLGLYFRF